MKVKEAPEDDPVLRMVDAVLTDLAVRSAMYIGRRREDGDDKTFVIQFGQEGRIRLSLPDLDSDSSLEVCVAQVQAELAGVLGAPVPLCPRHQHALAGTVEEGQLTWGCPVGDWRCALGEYEEQTWPQLEVSSLAPILMRRLHRRGNFPAVRTIGVSRSGDELVADFGLVETNHELIRALSEVAAPLPIRTHESPNVMIRTLPGQP